MKDKDKNIIKDAFNLTDDHPDGNTLCKLIEYSIIDLECTKESGKYPINDNEFYINYEYLKDELISNFKISNKEYKCTFKKEEDNKIILSKINNIVFDEENRYIGVFKTYCDIDKNTYEEFIAEKQFNSEKYSYEQFLLHISYVFYQKLFYINIEENEIPRSLTADEDIKIRIEQAIDEKKYFKQIEIKNDTYLIMDSLLFYREKRVYCVFKKIDNRYKLIQLSTTKETLSNKSNNLIENYSYSELPERTVKINEIDNTILEINFGEKSDNSFSPDNEEDFHNHIFGKKHFSRKNGRITQMFEKYKSYNGIPDSSILDEINLSEVLKGTEKKELEDLLFPKDGSNSILKKLFKIGLIKKIKDEVKKNIERDTYISGDDIYLYINNKNKERYLPPLKICFFMPIDFCGEKYYVVISCVKEGRNKIKFEYETIYTEYMKKNQIMLYESLRKQLYH